jgi:hypothetical protein
MVSTISVNWVAVIAATVINMGLGYLWYGPLFGKKWMALMGMDPNMKKDPEMMKKGNMAMMWLVPVSFISAYVLAHFIQYTDSTTWMDGAQCGFWLWLGFQLPIVIHAKLFGNSKTELLYLNAGYLLVSIMIQGALLAVWTI